MYSTKNDAALQRVSSENNDNDPEFDNTKTGLVMPCTN